MKTPEQVFQEVCGFGAIADNVSISLTKRDIYPAMERYAHQKRITLALFRDVLNRLDAEEITMSRAVELLNQKR